jgi:hypothetical protein
MKRLYLVVLAAGLVTSLPVNLQAQTTTPDKPLAASPADPAPAATPSPEASPSNDMPPKKKAAAMPKMKSMPKMKPMPKAMTQEEVNHSMESGTVPSRYRKNVPKEYQQYVPFEKQ